jgi:hypothetical protein
MPRTIVDAVKLSINREITNPHSNMDQSDWLCFAFQIPNKTMLNHYRHVARDETVACMGDAVDCVKFWQTLKH